MNVVANRTKVLSTRVPRPRFLSVGLRGLTKLGLLQTEQS
jgi:hypothetical protein